MLKIFLRYQAKKIQNKLSPVPAEINLEKFEKIVSCSQTFFIEYETAVFRADIRLAVIFSLTAIAIYLFLYGIPPQEVDFSSNIK